MIITICSALTGKVRLGTEATICPGENAVDEDAWKAACKKPLARILLETGALRVLPGRMEGEPMEPQVITPSGHGSTRQLDDAESRTLTIPGVEPPPPKKRPDTDGSRTAKALDKMRAKDAIAWVQELEDIDLLESVLIAETRSTVVRAAEKQLLRLRG